MRTSLVTLTYDPETLSKAVIDEFLACEQELFKKLYDLGMRTDEEVKSFIRFSFVFSIRHYKTLPEVFEGLTFAPEIAERYSLPFASLQGKISELPSRKKAPDFRTLTPLELSLIDELPPRQVDDANAMSVLGLSVLSSELAKLMLFKGQFEQFAKLQLVARELFVSWKLNSKGSIDKTHFAKANALKRHVQTYQRRDEVIEYWKAHISSALGNEKAADVLLKKFPYLSHRKLTEYVAAAKRKSTSS
ncbi:hypothetical protein [Nitrosospira sp. Nsp13]|uniref:hypothetical protein n=1 Tax=Nitrosospira sp. Nsp13 TaxID=1855332 RepID=UPI00088B8775|nr:hypothetical protein [Nitrosospira sp. Nsp13]SCY13586.1 hypothetical protein SAMN05216308_104213 [Nitrosospira sp. Nsp13]